MKRSLVALLCMCALKVLAENCPASFLGIKLGGTINQNIEPQTYSDQWLGFGFTPSSRVLKFNQYNLHATVRTRTVSSIGAGYLTYSRKEAFDLANDVMGWACKEYGGAFESVPIKGGIRQIWARYFVKKSFWGKNKLDGYILVETSQPQTGKYLTMITLYSPKYSDLEAREAKDYKRGAVIHNGNYRPNEIKANQMLDWAHAMSKGKHPFDPSQNSSVETNRSKSNVDFSQFTNEELQMIVNGMAPSEVLKRRK